MKRIYLDHAATSPLIPEARDEMIKVMRDFPGNPSSQHYEGRQARRVLEKYRAEIAECLDAEPSEVIFTSGATEADNLAIHGTVRSGDIVLSSHAEHKAVLEPLKQLESGGGFLKFVRLQEDGRILLDALDAELAEGPKLVSLMAVNNETGTRTNVREVADRCHAAGALFHTDVVQSIRYDLFSFGDSHADLASVSAHKLGGPKGVGVLLRRSGLEIRSLLHGGGQEKATRPGTENLIGIAGMATALCMSRSSQDKALDHISRLKRELCSLLVDTFMDRVSFNGSVDPAHSAPHIVNISLRRKDGSWMESDTLVRQMDIAGIAISSGSACTSGAVSPSHVLLAMGYGRNRASSGLRISFSAGNRPSDIAKVVEQMCSIARSSSRLDMDFE